MYTWGVNVNISPLNFKGICIRVLGIKGTLVAFDVAFLNIGLKLFKRTIFPGKF